ncbi:hypothetical protein FGG08_006923 [Glutinoglossum americanum]|uniref:BRCT domain-containing protein n=1 Tax=Glutinoglossum americanum TaxID=1670608 RepID=A0A9P8HRQ7_9PEZI|nr:hypothetical protein FGG08_006923 [Glutinoglossum americanum]
MAADAQGPDKNQSESQALFHDISFCIVTSETLSEAESRRLATLLVENGAEYIPLPSDSSAVPIEEITHIISSTTDFPAYPGACDAFVSVVKPEWVDVSASRKRLLPVRPYNPDPRLFFSGVVITCADIPEGDKDAIVGGVLSMGGLYTNGVTKLVTHIVALTEENDKCRQAASRGIRAKVVLPHWFDDCLKLGKKIDERPYSLPGPEIGLLTLADPVIMPSSPDLKGAVSAYPPEAPPISVEAPSSLRRGFKVFKDKKIMLSDDLGLGSRLRGTVEDLIASGGGSVTGSVHKADIFICQYREGSNYITASRAGKDVGNLTWLYYLITNNTWTSPMRRLLHYPIARDGLPGFKEFKITLSNYGGDARLYLENLVLAAGGTYTKSMRQGNTHLITARPYSEKCAAAQEWGIHMVNHLWLEESYAKWQIQSLTNPRYTHFPHRTNLGEVAGQTQIDRQALERLFYPADQEMTSEDDGGETWVHSDRNGATGSGVVQSVDNPRLKQTFTLPSESLNTPTPVARRAPIGTDNLGGLRTPTTSRLIGSDENEPPSTTSSRGAKERAVARLHDLAPDIALYEKEKKRVGGVVFGGKRNAIAEVDKGKKRSLNGGDQSGLDGGENPRHIKKAKSIRPPVTIKLLLTGYKRWVSSPKTEDEERKRLRDLGVLCVQNPLDCTHLAAPSLVRTQKFVSAMAAAPVVISTHWVDACLDKGRLLRPEDFLLKDTEGESRLGLRLADALKKAKQNRRSLLADETIYCTLAVYDTYKIIIEANGGRCLIFRGSSRGGAGSNASKAAGTAVTDDESDGKGNDDMFLVSGETPEEKNLWTAFEKMAASKGRGARVVRTEWLLDVVMKQELNWKEAEKFYLSH